MNPAETLSRGTGSCRDFANLFMQAARHLGLASRFVSGYLHAEPSAVNYGATHAWAEVFLPGAGWKGFDPTIGEIVGIDLTVYSQAKLNPVARRLNERPRKTLNHETSAERFAQSVVSIS